MFLWTNMANYPLSIPVTHYLELYIYNLNPMSFDIIILFQVNSMDIELQLWICGYFKHYKKTNNKRSPYNEGSKKSIYWGKAII